MIRIVVYPRFLEWFEAHRKLSYFGGKGKVKAKM